jgi:hypothetical protein
MAVLLGFYQIRKRPTVVICCHFLWSFVPLVSGHPGGRILERIPDKIEGWDDIQADLKVFTAIVDVLLRNGILRQSTTPDQIKRSEILSALKRNLLPGGLRPTATTRYHLTDLGREFIKACQVPKRDNGPEADCHTWY